MEATIQQIKDQLADNELRGAVNKLRSIFAYANSELEQKAVSVAGQLKGLEADEWNDVIDHKESNMRRNKIVRRIFHLLDELQEHPHIFEAYAKISKEVDRSMENKKEKPLSLQAKDVLLQRMAQVKDKNLHVPALWIDDPTNNPIEAQLLDSIGVQLTFAPGSDLAEQMIRANPYTFILSSMNRSGDEQEGIKFLQKLRINNIHLPMIFYIALLDRSRGVPPYAFGITNYPDELLHLVMDLLERRY